MPTTTLFKRGSTPTYRKYRLTRLSTTTIQNNTVPNVSSYQYPLVF
jgi:hypothetical protein